MAMKKREGDHSYITYISTFKYSLGGENKQKLPFSNPPPTPRGAYVIYEWSQGLIQKLKFIIVIWHIFLRMRKIEKLSEN